MKTNHDEILRKILEDIDEHGYLNHRESNTYEFKETFNMGNKSLYARTLACFANNKGGYILFGVKDKPRNLIGVDKIKFDSIKQEDITTFLKDHYEPEIKWDSGTVISQEKYFGYIYAHEAEEKPVICTSNTKESSQGDIFYRYRGQNKKIGYTELKKNDI
ncbi:ATP-binding protein [Candidatus Magnetomonas plexicatena]|uniref:ATP-binding protein n=1 Tax=Candidatus Magnetomonas plexicatena TaxID=2552947 RepID=UPI0011011317|nr:ATP-binding protein [Nitrospirales bacterium LBB_01]